jgi:hypothetical protein
MIRSKARRNLGAGRGLNGRDFGSEPPHEAARMLLTLKFRVRVDAGLCDVYFYVYSSLFANGLDY